jgi:hypothetical protein
MKIWTRAALAIAITIGAPAYAKDAADGYITGFLFFSNGTGFFFQSGTVTGATMACDTGGLPHRWGIDPSTPGGQALLSVLLTAKNTHQIVKIYGAGTCLSGLNSEQAGLIITDDAQ